MSFDSVMLWMQEYGLFLTLFLASLTVILFVIWKKIPDQKQSPIIEEIDCFEEETEPKKRESSVLPSFPNIPQEAFDFYDKNRDSLIAGAKPSNGFTKTEYLLMYLLKNNKVDGKIKRKGQVEAFGLNWDLDLTLEMEKSQKTEKKTFQESGETEPIF